MPNAATNLLDANIAHEVGLRRLANSTLDKVIAEINRAIPDLERQIRERIGWIAARGYNSSDFTLQRLEANLRGLKEVLRESYSAANKVLRGDMQALAKYEAQFQKAALSEAVGPTIAAKIGVSMPTPEMLRAIVTSRPFQGGLLRDWGRSLSEQAFSNVRQSIRTGLLQQESIDQIIRRTFGKAVRVKGQWVRQGGGFDIITRHAEAVTRTAAAHVTGAAKQAVYDANQDIVKGYIWSATLDSKTTEGCAIRDGKEWDRDYKPVGHSIPWEPKPRHWGCRSDVTARLATWKELGIDADELTGLERQSMDGKVPASTTYGDWLARQRETEIGKKRIFAFMGQRRGDAFIRGDLTFDDLFNSKGEFLSIEELARIEGIEL
jgi:SPP1 gp7 family putative phage head morphogenesis protein